MGGKSIGFRSCDGHTKKKLMKKKTLKGSFRLPIGIHRIPHSFSTHPTHWCKTSSPYRKCRMGHAEQPTALGDTHDPRAQRKKKRIKHQIPSIPSGSKKRDHHNPHNLPSSLFPKTMHTQPPLPRTRQHLPTLHLRFPTNRPPILHHFLE
jgi:hypothetical protein